MKKLLLSMFVVAASGGYVLSQSARLDAENQPDLNTDLLTSTAPPVAAPQPTALILPNVTGPAPVAIAIPAAPMPAAAPTTIVAELTPSPAAVPAEPPPVPSPRPVRRVELSGARVINTAASLSAGQYRDGIYPGPVTNAYYGYVQVEADVQGGKLTRIRILQYPNDRRTSRYINSQALPILKQEAITAQSANVDMVSGATLTSRAYIMSLAAALAGAQA